jgi:hypothetical protein
LIQNERISKFAVIGNYIFIRTFTDSGVLCGISGDNVIAKLINYEDLDIAVCSTDMTTTEDRYNTI